MLKIKMMEILEMWMDVDYIPPVGTIEGMPRNWEVEQHPETKQIIQALIDGAGSNRSIGTQYDISEAAIRRYLNCKLLPQLAASKTAQQKLAEVSFVEKIDDIEVMLRDILTEARSEDEKDSYLAIRTIAEIRKGLEFLAKIHGLIQDVTINITQIEQWTEIKAIIIDATRDAPEVREAIINGLANAVGG